MSFYLPILLQRYATNPLNKNLDFNEYKGVNCSDPILDQDVATKKWAVDTFASGGATEGTLPFFLKRPAGAGGAIIGQFSNPSGDDLQLNAPTATGKMIFSDIHGIDFVNSPITQSTSSGTGVALTSTGNNDVLSIFKNPSNLSGNLITLNNSGNFTGGQNAINITHGTNNGAIAISNSGTGGSLNITQVGAGHAIQINKNSGSGLIPLIEVNNSGTSSIGLCRLVNNNAASTGDNLYLETNASDANANCLEIIRTGNGRNILSTANGGNDNVVLTSATTAGKTLTINANQTNGSVGVDIIKAGTGNALNIGNTGTGNAMNITSSGSGIMNILHTNTGANGGITFTKSGGTGGRMIDLNYSNSGSDDILFINRTNNTGNMINLTGNTGGTMINSTQAGAGANIIITSQANTGSTTSAQFIKSGTSNADNVFIRNNSSVGASTGIALNILNEGVADCLRIQDQAGDTSLFRVDANGNCGINVPSSALINIFESNGGFGTTTTRISQGTTSIDLSTTDTAVGTSTLNVSSVGATVIGRSEIIMEPTKGTAVVGTTPRIRMTVASGSNNGVLFQGNNATAGTQFRFGFTSGSTAETTLNVYSDTATRRARLGQQDIYGGIPSGVLEITRNATPHGTTIPHILLNGTNATGGVVMNCNSGRIAAVSDPIDRLDAANMQWVLSQVGGGSTGFTLANGTSGNANNFPIINMATPSGIIDNTTLRLLSTNKEYVDKTHQATIGRWFSSWNQTYQYTSSPIFWTTPNVGAPIDIDVDGASTPNTGWYAEAIGTNFTSQFCYLDPIPNAYGSGRTIYCWRPRFIGSIFKITVNMNLPSGVVNWNINTLYWNGPPNNVQRYGMPKIWVPINTPGNRSVSFTRYFKFITIDDYITIVDDTTAVPQTITTGVEGSPQSSNGWEVIIEYIGRDA